MPLPVKDTAPVERQLLRDVVYNRLYEGILDGTLEPGETLLDEKLTTWLGVSRTPIREALMKLADIGLVEMAPNRYTRVAPIDLRAIDEAVYTSGLLHEYAARTAVPTLDSAAIGRLEKALKQVRKTAKSGQLPALGQALNDFFLEFERDSHNQALLAISEGLGPQLLRYVSVWHLPFATEDIAEQVSEIFDAAKAKDGDKTGELIKALFEPTYDQFVADYRRTNAEIDEAPII
ncbi:GntR family transcriptional regulator [Leifsonia xyli subsp. cynodontis DSM 46306]|jgi:DNA-binding GntR family transcriptional regulator|uniref:HTH gntR-type domain-containing protein n=1 Tax=Leifsonia xyli subsp. cynodontis DSM 46306 TaxID=1389489 RepID=U3P6D2_LEIXC|nr:GntR family transcriptional regulator [Leifsonia xyli]AGW40472.1 GntR family transcriptional regulator [Leifsonia xyli subsp. cynodontis DSM 46306]